MNILAFSERGSSAWERPMPTFLVDDRDICSHLGLMWLSKNHVAGIGIAPSDAFIYPHRTVFHRIGQEHEEWQNLLSMHLGDCIVSIVSVRVVARGDWIEWAQFNTSEKGVQIEPCGPFLFARSQYASIIGPLCHSGFSDAKKNWPQTVSDSMLQSTWWTELRQ